ncbi:esterase/lipase family protein [Azohydromonas sediminis]|uniref:esterase/lipase family protein n=1 Tax=Azohydromonas sediminis TaxID=2259674 RepID=UPI000E6574BD|nr:hypothetical protein [Azohydromonas sediminis]
MVDAFHPIIYVRGYAMTAGERDETAADPFCGFNTGSTVYRAAVERAAPAKKFVFESPLLRLTTDFGYRDVYENGLGIMDPDWQPPPGPDGEPGSGIARRSIIVYRYYDSGSRLLGDGKAREIEVYAKGLSDLILRVRQLVCARKDDGVTPASFRCYLVAHSMGGLVVRAFLQNARLGDDRARRSVDKVFTYGTPHNGIEVLGINVPSWLSASEIDTFNRERMAKYLDLAEPYKRLKRVDLLPERAFPSQRFFCMVGTNRGDYEAAMGLSRAFAGHGSDGLVRIENARVWGLDDAGQMTAPAPTAYAYRAHSGFFGLVNSEEAYQNLTRFLFGDLRVDIWVDVDEVRLPKALQRKKVEALYQFELLAGPRGKRWYLTRRVAEEDSPACRTHAQLAGGTRPGDRNVYLSTVFLANRARVNPERASLAYAMTLGVRVPDYQVDQRFWADEHYEGGYLFRDTAIIEMVPPAQPGHDWVVNHGWQSETATRARHALSYDQLKSGQIQFTIPFDSGADPGIAGHIRLVAQAWNV